MQGDKNVTKASANPRRYSRGPESLDPTMPLNVYMQVRAEPHNIDGVISKLEYVAEKHPDAIIDLAAVRRTAGRIYLTLEVNMGPARQALRGTSPELHAGYRLLWDVVKTLFNHNPVFCNPPSPDERATAPAFGKRIRLRQPTATPVAS